MISRTPPTKPARSDRKVGARGKGSIWKRCVLLDSRALLHCIVLQFGVISWTTTVKQCFRNKPSQWHAITASHLDLPSTLLLPVEVRCYIVVWRCLAQNTRCHTSPPMPDSFVHVSRETPDVTPCHNSPSQGVWELSSNSVSSGAPHRSPKGADGAEDSFSQGVVMAPWFQDAGGDLTLSRS